MAMVKHHAILRGFCPIDFPARGFCPTDPAPKRIKVKRVRSEQDERRHKSSRQVPSSDKTRGPDVCERSELPFVTLSRTKRTQGAGVCSKILPGVGAPRARSAHRGRLLTAPIKYKLASPWSWNFVAFAPNSYGLNGR